jgi:hypothetical protein
VMGGENDTDRPKNRLSFILIKYKVLLSFTPLCACRMKGSWFSRAFSGKI